MEWKYIITRPSKIFTLCTDKDKVKVRKEKGFIETGDYIVCVEVRKKYAGSGVGSVQAKGRRRVSFQKTGEQHRRAASIPA
jgi:hypothetical protein